MERIKYTLITLFAIAILLAIFVASVYLPNTPWPRDGSGTNQTCGATQCWATPQTLGEVALPTQP